MGKNLQKIMKDYSDETRPEFEKWLLEEYYLEAEWIPERNCYMPFSAHLAFKAFMFAKAQYDER